MTKPKNQQNPQKTVEPIQRVNAVNRSGATVTVACKMPGGLLLRVFDMVDHDEPVMGGGMKTVKRAQEKGEPVRLFGTAIPFGQIPAHKIVAGYALTPNVSKDFFDLWLKQNHDLDAVKNNLVFAWDTEAGAEAKAKEQRTVRSGLEPLNPDKAAKDPRMPARIETAKKEEDQAA